ncbi:glutathione S-transferase 1-1-like [Phymastichus coffea]|uniref:glutathione S-transferase 1-1-like n=1 Tax=Phymastichus coffea TaxID=108790 RepID=UPI00273C7E7B|nr:glutathione S-transferase 1-1-like [Phymastichus coffea]XP_058791381.1 glutathione S-transferase 1-1-like [Phymastichus coffea]XP_058791382.1 glutathione S-transferase 1-1-like [Phymastichus coffea]XP_058791383.1 glutathione S-transferase 1-1-like [Phymastichus coffea]
MTIDLYYIPPSPPCRAVMMLAKFIGVHLNLKPVNVIKGDHLKPLFRKLNPAHTVPTMDDHGVVLWESRPIMTYLVMKYAKNDALYPKDPEKRGTVEYRLFFDLGTLYDSIFAYGSPVLFGRRDSPDEKLMAPLITAFELLNGFLENSNFVAGDELTIADFSIVCSVSTAQSFGFDFARFDNVGAWYERCRIAMQKGGFEEINEAGARAITDVFNANLKI